MSRSTHQLTSILSLLVPVGVHDAISNSHAVELSQKTNLIVVIWQPVESSQNTPIIPLMSLNRNRPAENLLVGAALRAASRLSQGASIQEDEFDNVALSLLHTVMGNAEIKEHGQLYAQASQADHVGLPGAIFELNKVSTPYTRQQYIQDAIALAPEILTYPGNKVASLAECLSDDNKQEGLQTGVILYIAPQEETPPPVEDSATVLKLENTERLQVGDPPTGQLTPRQVHLAFRCDEGEEETTSPKTHWGIAAGTDHHRLQGYESITAEQNNVRIEQRAERGLELHLQFCKGDGSIGQDEWAAPLKEALSKLFWECQREIVDNPELSIALLAQTTSFFSFISGLRNQDPNGSLVRWTVLLTPSALNWLWGRPSHQVRLGDTDGSSLYLHRESVAAANNEATIKCYSRNPEDVWNAGPNGPIPSYQGMPMVRFQGEMFGLLANPRGNQLCSTRWDPSTSSWEPPRPMAGHQTTTQIAGAVIKDTFYVAFRNLHGNIQVISTIDLNTWTPAQQVGEAKTDSSPAVGFNGRGLLAAYRATDNQIYSTSNNTDGSWNAWTPVPGARSLAAPTLMWFDGAMNLIYVGEDSRVRFQRRPPGSAEWSASFVFAAARTCTTCKVASFGSVLMMGIRGLDERGTVQLIRYTPGEYSMQQLDNCHSIGPLGLCNWDGKLWVTYSDMES